MPTTVDGGWKARDALLCPQVQYIIRWICAFLASDPSNAAKHGLSAYIVFANEQSDKIREENPCI